MTASRREPWQRDRDWAYQHLPAAESILAQATIRLLHVELASEQLDRKQATDLVVTTDVGAVAWRARREGCGYRDLTLRFRRRANRRAEWEGGFEVDKIAGGFARHYLYTWVAGPTLEYALVDLDAVREFGLIEKAVRTGREQVNDDGVTSFTWLTLDECEDAGAIKDLLFTLAGWRLARPSAPKRAVPWAKRTDDWICGDCRKYVALRDTGLCGDCWLRHWKAAQAA